MTPHTRTSSDFRRAACLAPAFYHSTLADQWQDVPYLRRARRVYRIDVPVPRSRLQQGGRNSLR